MERCPTCGARRVEGPSCHRCQTDLRQVRAIEWAAAECRRRALMALERGRKEEAQVLASRACALHRSMNSLIVRAVVAVGDGDFPLALELWREIRVAETRRQVQPTRTPSPGRTPSRIHPRFG